MAKSAFWKSDWFLGVVVVPRLLAGGSDLLHSLRHESCDLGVHATLRTRQLSVL